MTEDFLHFIWKFGLFERNNLKADTGDAIEIISLGEYNAHSGPDFLNARIKIGTTIWAGNIEVHMHSSDWFLHGHHQDKAYENVILHVVYDYNKPLLRNTGEIIPTLLLSFENGMYENYTTLTKGKRHNCMEKMKRVDSLIIDIWLNTLLVERLQNKTQYILQLLEKYKNDWEMAFYISMARSFGFGINAVPFEMLVQSIPYTLLLRHRDQLQQLEALLFGQAGFLGEAHVFNDYYNDLQKEYLHLKNKYTLHPLQKHIWKFMRLRPVNFPTVRLAQFASFIRNSEGLFSRIQTIHPLAGIKALIQTTASSFWDTHYSFDAGSPEFPKNMGEESVNSIIINCIVPFVFTKGLTTGNQELKDRAIQWMNQIPSEKNKIVRMWQEMGVNSGSALYSQALIQLHNHYCREKKCLSCSIGAQIITTIA